MVGRKSRRAEDAICPSVDRAGFELCSWVWFSHHAPNYEAMTLRSNLRGCLTSAVAQIRREIDYPKSRTGGAPRFSPYRSLVICNPLQRTSLESIFNLLFHNDTSRFIR
jgi:hypothetical protein